VIPSPASVNQGLVADRGPSPQPRLVQAALERGLADADDLYGLLGRKAFDVSQHDGRPVIRRQFGQGLAQRLAQLCLSSLRDGSSWASAGTRSARRRAGSQVLLLSMDGEPARTTAALSADRESARDDPELELD
jgi:hypothetical protein